MEGILLLGGETEIRTYARPLHKRTCASGFARAAERSVDVRVVNDAVKLRERLGAQLLKRFLRQLVSEQPRDRFAHQVGNIRVAIDGEHFQSPFLVLVEVDLRSLHASNIHHIHPRGKVYALAAALGGGQAVDRGPHRLEAGDLVDRERKRRVETAPVAARTTGRRSGAARRRSAAPPPAGRDRHRRVRSARG